MKSKGKKPPKEEMVRRWMEIISKMNQGISRRQIVLDYMQQYSVNENVAYEAFKKAMRMLNEDNETYKDYLRDLQLSRYEELLQSAYDKGDLKTVNAVLANIDKLTGLLTQKIEQNGEVVIKFE